MLDAKKDEGAGEIVMVFDESVSAEERALVLEYLAIAGRDQSKGAREILEDLAGETGSEQSHE